VFMGYYSSGMAYHIYCAIDGQKAFHIGERGGLTIHLNRPIAEIFPELRHF
jgi:hypothetical protein